MTKAENRAAAERMRKLNEEWRTKAVQAEFVELDRLRRYFIRERTLGYVRPLIEAIDNYVDQITGDRTALYAKNHSIG